MGIFCDTYQNLNGMHANRIYGMHANCIASQDRHVAGCCRARFLALASRLARTDLPCADQVQVDNSVGRGPGECSW